MQVSSLDSRKGLAHHNVVHLGQGCHDFGQLLLCHGRPGVQQREHALHLHQEKSHNSGMSNTRLSNPQLCSEHISGLLRSTKHERWLQTVRAMGRCPMPLWTAVAPCRAAGQRLIMRQLHLLPISRYCRHVHT